MRIFLFGYLTMLTWVTWVPRSAFALDFAEFVGLSIASPRIQNQSDPTIQSALGINIGLGVALGYRLFEQIEIETGLTYFGQSFSTTTAFAPRTGYSFWSAQVPLLIRYWFSDKFSVGAGGYYSHGIGNVGVTQGPSSVLGNTVVGFQDLSWTTEEKGICLTGRYRSPLSDLISMIVEARTLIGTQSYDISGSGTVQTFTLQLVGGISFIL